MSNNSKRVAIIGAGASGLPSIHWALLYGFEPVCFELTEDIGGLWRYKNDKREFNGIKVGSVMKSTVINTSKEFVAYSDFPPKEDAANFMHHSDMMKYFREYAEKWGLLEYIKFNHCVKSIKRHNNFETTAQWDVCYVDNNTIKHEETFDAVLLANGHYSEPNIPDPWPNQESFKGKISHARDYHDYHRYEDKVVAVVGLGNSGGDIAVELSRVAKQVYLITRRGAWIKFRLVDGGYPLDIDSRIENIIEKFMPLRLLGWIKEKQLMKQLDHKAYGLKPKHGIFNAHPTVNDELPNRLCTHSIKLKPNIKLFTSNGIVFDDDIAVENIDEIILATGYKFNFKLIEDGNLITVKDNVVSLYLNMFPSELSPQNTLAIIGLIQPFGSLMPIAELQARVFFEALSGFINLLSKSQMLDTISDEHKKRLQRYVNSPRHTIQVDYVPYLDQLADIIGCKPSVSSLIFKDPTIAWKILFGPVTSYTYRIQGRYPWEGARKAIFETEQRILNGLAPEGKKTKICKTNMTVFEKVIVLSLITALCYIIYFYFMLLK